MSQDRTHAHRQGREPFVMLPAALLYDLHIDPDAIVLWLVLDDLARSAPGVCITQDRLAPLLRCSPRQLRYLLTELVDGGWVARITNPGRPSTYAPLRRARPTPGDKSGDDPGTFVPGSQASTPAQICRGQGSDYIPRTHEEEEHDPLAGLGTTAPSGRRRPAWCGYCDDRTRMVGDDRPARCPTCHPLSW